METMTITLTVRNISEDATPADLAHWVKDLIEEKSYDSCLTDFDQRLEVTAISAKTVTKKKAVKSKGVS